ncbi:MAG: DUF2232 domain-containing protein [Nitrospirae bacterium]|nr:DUF2232 domain-containing protein [Nitrospirota bacterium]
MSSAEATPADARPDDPGGASLFASLLGAVAGTSVVWLATARVPLALKPALACLVPVIVLQAARAAGRFDVAPLSVLAACAVVAALDGPLPGVGLALTLGLLSVFLARAILRRSAPPDALWLAVAGVTFIHAVAWIGLSAASWAGLPIGPEAIARLWPDAPAEPAEWMPPLGLEPGPWSADRQRVLAEVLKKFGPALAVVDLAVVGGIALRLTQALGALRLGPPGLSWVPGEWRAPSLALWGFIIAGGLVGLGPDQARDAAWNGVALLLFVFLLQGISIVAFYLRKVGVPPLVRGLVVVLLVLQLPLAAALALLGLFDYWLDVRRFGRVQEPEA